MPERRPRKTYQIKASSTTNTYAYCRVASRAALERAEAEPNGALYFRMMAGVFASFAVEAFLNHLGQARVRDWETLERKLGPWEKLRLLRERLSLSADVGRRPFQTLRTILKLRDALAHGKTETVVSDRVTKRHPREEDRWPEPEWKKLCTLTSVTRMVGDAEAIVRELHAQTGASRDPFAGLGHAWSGVGEIEPDHPNPNP